ncbi:MAG: Mycothiol acetyltransferase [Candidatus Methanofastidiosum methylothiophilum]|uniref:Mycothiol acetyltransferase n=1 Tax=Candidatus Methanofastidiosum methylothiophilum TaxID=1705564 RepID=A0A150IZX9_9EURY|nr:MAG: Mycothiol acetyltransferase [Candidatus Methanofastidiosum methylthiophilus]KYC47939.1 MAG: Mycothiol acetyltransferase [Candidatus Methanofastidiosum methylthiophilus]KYC50557.1 MAG: Mycothiol acetyltransferase [Candidatus Methanofastidiosum methylthiophilus]
MIKILDIYFPGIIGFITQLHAEYYSKNWDFGLYFESKVATELSEFLNRFDPSRDGIWTLHVDDAFVGSIVIDGLNSDSEGARLRWFILDPKYQGRGMGNLLMEKAILFCKDKGYRRVYLWTFEGLDAARYLYEKFGFKLCKEHEDTQWGKKVTEEIFELLL